MSKILNVANFASTSGGFKVKWMEMEILQLNNMLTVPMKILNVLKEPNASGNGFVYRVEVEDCADEKEWATLCKAWDIGYSAGKDPAKNKFCNPQP